MQNSCQLAMEGETHTLTRIHTNTYNREFLLGKSQKYKKIYKYSVKI